jgi:two-component system phosphate regulon response regulator PhoB
MLLLLIEDEPDLARVVTFALQQGGHEVLHAATGRNGLHLARTRKPALVVLDLMLPDLTGTEVCRALKRDPATADVPVIMATAKGEEVDRIVGLELGAEDYVVKPFSTRELVLRVDAVLRRTQGPKPQAASEEFGCLRIDRDAHRAWIDGGEIGLTLLEWKLLVTLHDRRDRVQARATLLDDVWGQGSDVDERTIDTHVKRLREKLGAAAVYVETVRGVGYRFAGMP